MIELDVDSERIAPTGGHIEGQSPLAGDLDPTARLIRESVQNSWDARDPERAGPVQFRVDARDLEFDELDNLRELLPLDKIRELRGFSNSLDDDKGRGIVHPALLLERNLVRVLVISDRNTVGLCGPTIGGREWSPIRDGHQLVRGQQRFANFVRNKGRASSDTGGGDGGAYGIGKSALWLASRCGTILIHTRTTDEEGLPAERFIGSILGEDFTADEHTFTGRHFVGRRDNQVIEPLTGYEAAEALSRLRIPSYDVDGQQVYGTSIIIVEPRLPLSWETEMTRVRDAVRWHVWPKRVSGLRSAESGPDMEFRITWNNNPVEIPDPFDDPEIMPYARALRDCVRQRREPVDPGHDATVDFDIECRRPKRRLGDLKLRRGGESDENVFHLTITEEDLNHDPDGEGSDEHDGEFPVVDFKRPWGQIALIRREPLLLVRYEPIKAADDGGNYVGVFLSADDPEVEDALTRAEPPAHDDWNDKIVPKNNKNDHRKTFVRRTLAEVQSARDQFVKSLRPMVRGPSDGSGSQQLSKFLTDKLLGGRGGDRPPTPTGGSHPPSAKKPRAILRHVESYQQGDQTVHNLAVSLTNADSNRAVRLSVVSKGYDSEGSMPVETLVRYSWFRNEGIVANGPVVTINEPDPKDLMLIIGVEGSLRIRPKVHVETVDVVD